MKSYPRRNTLFSSNDIYLQIHRCFYNDLSGAIDLREKNTLISWRQGIHCLNIFIFVSYISLGLLAKYLKSCKNFKHGKPERRL